MKMSDERWSTYIRLNTSSLASLEDRLERLRFHDVCERDFNVIILTLVALSLGKLLLQRVESLSRHGGILLCEGDERLEEAPSPEAGVVRALLHGAEHIEEARDDAHERRVRHGEQHHQRRPRICDVLLEFPELERRIHSRAHDPRPHALRLQVAQRPYAFRPFKRDLDLIHRRRHDIHHRRPRHRSQLGEVLGREFVQVVGLTANHLLGVRLEHVRQLGRDVDLLGAVQGLDVHVAWDGHG
mmetsp:Transcript_4438/g.19892  ORF Transcript_4438/g.19892 Transcript_4438/m.19892 type:complete len:242 (-) Transcript_4438:73-798(-)